MAERPTETTLRDRIRRAICEAEGFAFDDDSLEPDEYGEVADAVLAVLPTPVDQAAILRKAADWFDEESLEYTGNNGWAERKAARELRRMADEASSAS